MINRPQNAQAALSSTKLHLPQCHDVLSDYITHLEEDNFRLKTGLLLAAANESARTNQLDTQYDKYLLPPVTNNEVTA